jgi:membrane-associated phospholipid phosphatase
MPASTLVALHRLPAEFWYALTRLGEMQLMWPIGIALIAWLAWSGERLRAAGWLALLMAAVGITTASKIAFIGWGIGSASLNFAGFSGHAMHAAAVFPLLMGCVTAGRPRWLRIGAVAFAFMLAALVALSRVVVGAQSPSESLLGFLLGALASGLALTLGPPPQSHLPRWLLASVIAGLLLNSSAMPTLPTHGMVTRLALQLSGRDTPYTRHMMLREEKLRQQRARQIAAAPAAPAVPAAAGAL